MEKIHFISLSALVLGFVAVGTAAYADDPKATSEADVTFSLDNTPVDPTNPEVVDPTDPEGPDKEVDPGDNGSGGDGTKAFNINWISNFHFGDIKIKGTAMSAYAQPTTLTWSTPAVGTVPTPTTNLAPFLQVTDNRGKGAGWNVTVTGTEFVEQNVAQGTTPATLNGASIYLTDGIVIGSSEMTNYAPTIVLFGTNNNMDILSSVGSSSTVFNADEGKGQGTWSLVWGGTTTDPALLQTASGVPSAGVRISVPVSALPKDGAAYKSTLTWTLADAPAD